MQNDNPPSSPSSPFRPPSSPSRPRWVAYARGLSFSLLAVLSLFAGSARGSIMVALDLPDLVRQSEHIAVVDVVSIRAAWDSEHQRIYSTIDLKVVESWKAAPAMSGGSPVAGDHLKVVQLGGTVGDITMTVTGLGSFAPGERSLVFLRGPATHAQLVGMTQGKRPLRYAPSSRQWLVSPSNLSQAKLVRAQGPVASTPLPAAPSSPMLPSPSPSPSPSSSSAPTAVPTLSPSRATGATAALAREMPLDDFRAQVQRLLVATPVP